MLVRSRGGPGDRARSRPPREDTAVGGANWCVPPRSAQACLSSDCGLTTDSHTAVLKRGGESAQYSGSRSISPNSLDPPNNLPVMPYFQPLDVTGSMIRLPQASLVDPSPTPSHQDQYTGMPGHPTKLGKLSPNPFQELHYLGWNTDLPDPQVMNHLYATVFCRFAQSCSQSA